MLKDPNEENNSSSIVTQKKTMKKELDDNEANRISEGLNNLGKYYIIPESLKSFDEDKQYEQAIKIKGKDITHIMKKAEINFDSMIYYLGLQIVSNEINENIAINYYLFEEILNLISLLSIKFKNKNNLNITFFSFDKILKNCGIRLEEILPYLHLDIINIKREEIKNDNIPICKALQIRQIKNVISPEILNTNIDLMKGTDSLVRIEQNNFDDLDKFRNEESNYLNDLIRKIELKKEEIKNIIQNEENHIIEIKKGKNEVFYIKNILYDKLIENIDDNNDLKIKDINGNDIIITKEILEENKNNNFEPLIKIYKDNNKTEYLFISKDIINNKYNNEFKYIKQKEIFKGKSINGDKKEIKGLFMDIICDILPKSNEEIIKIKKIKENDEIKEDNIKSPEKEKTIEIINIQNSTEKLKQKEEINDEIEPEYENIINPYNNMPFKQIRNMRREESKNEDNNEERIRNIQREINPSDKKTYRIRRAILFKRQKEEKEKEKK